MNEVVGIQAGTITETQREKRQDHGKFLWIHIVPVSGPIHTGKQHATRHAKKWSQVPFCCLLRHALLGVCSVDSTVAFNVFSRPSLLRVSPRVQCGWGLKSFQSGRLFSAFDLVVGTVSSCGIYIF